jgi:hypothetical protein
LVRYDSVKIAHPVRLELDKIKIEMGLSFLWSNSYSVNTAT